MNPLPGKTKYIAKGSLNEGNDEDALVSTKDALRFLYEEALRNNHYAIAVILQDTLNVCEEIIDNGPCYTSGLKRQQRQ
jgi:hypothetical protein